MATGGALVVGAPSFSGVKATSAAAKPLRILILGGTGFIGPYFVRAAVARGHTVSVFNRGKGHADLPAEVERLLGDRNSDLQSIQNRDWDAVLDLPTYGPHWVRTLGQALKERVHHYTFISTVAAYEPPKMDGTLTEKSPLRAYDGSEDPYTLTGPRNTHEYGALKVLCEGEAEKQFPGRTLVLRPGYIAGPGEGQGQFAYWTLRMEQGGEVLVAGEPSTPVQFIDVRDLTEWCIRLIEKRTTGVYNVTGPATPMSLDRFIHAARHSSSSSALTWVPAAWLAAQTDKALWEKLLYWSLEADSWGWAMQMNIERALATGLTFRPMSVTRQDAVEEYRQQPTEQQAKLLPVSWPEYLKREKEILAAWHAQQKERG